MEDVVNAMVTKIRQVGLVHVSNHSSDPDVLNAIDIQPKKGEAQQQIKDIITNNSQKVNKVLTGNDGPIKNYIPPHDAENANHVEISQPTETTK